MKNWEKIEKKINDIEKKYECEVVTVIAQQSSSYMEVKFWYSFFASLLAYFLAVNFLFPSLEFWFLHEYAYGLFIFSIQLLFLLILQIPFVGNRFIGQIKKDENVKRRACESFYNMNIHRTENRRSLLVFISKFEHKFFLIPDVGLSFEKEENQWASLASKMKLFLKENKFELAFEKCIDELDLIFSNNKIVRQKNIGSFENSPKKV